MYGHIMNAIYRLSHSHGQIEVLSKIRKLELSAKTRCSTGHAFEARTVFPQRNPDFWNRQCFHKKSMIIYFAASYFLFQHYCLRAVYQSRRFPHLSLDPPSHEQEDQSSHYCRLRRSLSLSHGLTANRRPGPSGPAGTLMGSVHWYTDFPLNDLEQILK